MSISPIGQNASGYKPSKVRAGKVASVSFDNISIEVLSLYTVLKECEETLFNRSL